MNSDRLIITPETKISILLDTYPQLEDVFIDIAPFYKKLKNPVLRKTIAKVTSIKQAAVVADISLELLINRLRKEVGQDKVENIIDDDYSIDSPDWFNPERIVESLDARETIAGGGHPLDQVILSVRQLNENEIYELKTPFLPAPLIDKVKDIGFKSWSYQAKDNLFKSYFIKE